MKEIPLGETDEQIAIAQGEIQRPNFKTRDVYDYSLALVPSRRPHVFGEEELPCELLRRPSLDGDVGSHDSQTSLEQTLLVRVLRRLTDRQKEPVHWADFGGGFGVAQREYRFAIDSTASVRTTNVDILTHDTVVELAAIRKKYGSDTPKYQKLQKLLVGKHASRYAPEFLRANMETVTLPEKADLITSLESIQYVLDPLRAITNMYENLKPGGIMAIMCMNGLDEAMQYSHSSRALMKDFTKGLRDAGVAHAYHGISAWFAKYRVYAVVKKPHTTMVQLTSVESHSMDTMKQHNRRIIYEKPFDRRPIAIVPQ